MKRTYLSLVAILAMGLGFTGCGSSSSGTTAVTTTTSGTVSGSYYEGATVCFDTDSDGSCTGEASAVTSGADGSFTLTLTGNTSYDIIAIIPSGAIKHDVLGDTGTTITDSTKTIFAIPSVAITQAETDGGKVILSAISTELYTYQKTSGNENKTIAQIMEAVAAKIGMNKDDLLKDFNSSTLNEEIRLTLKEKTETLEGSIQGEDTIAGIKTASSTSVGAMSLPNSVEVIKN